MKSFVYTEMKHSLLATKEKEQYDTAAKRLLRHKSILAHILIRTVKEFKGMDWREVEPLIEGEPLIGQVPVDPGLTNTTYTVEGKQILGFNTELTEENEGLARFDSLFYVRTRDNWAKILIGIEAQKAEPDRYPILNRAVYYKSRMTSSQKDREFTNQNYGDIKQVYSIWICMNMDECSCEHIHLTGDKILGTHEWKGRLDLANIIMIGVPNDLPGRSEQYELHRLLTALFGRHLKTEDRIKILRDEYDIPIEIDIGEEVKEMCNLSEGVWEEAMEKGYAQGMAQGMTQGMTQGIAQGMMQGITSAKRAAIFNLHKKNMSIQWIAEVLEMLVEEVEGILKQVE